MPRKRITRKVDSFIKRLDDLGKAAAHIAGRKPHVSLYSTDDPVDKLHLVLAPLVSSAGVAYPKISEPLPPFTSKNPALNDLALWNNISRKLDCIPGFRTARISKDIENQLHEVGAVFFSPPVGIHPESTKTSAAQASNSFDGILNSLLGYMLSDYQITPASRIVLNIKKGGGGPIQNIQDAKNLAISIKDVLDRIQVNSSIFLTSFHQPVGQALGNSLEIREALDTLKGLGPLDMLKLTLELGSEILLLADKIQTKIEAKEVLKKAIVYGEGLKKFKEIIEAQKGDPRISDDYSLLPLATKRIQIRSRKSGFIHKINMGQLHSLYLKLMSSGRESKHSQKRGIGFLLQKKIGEWIQKGESLVEVHLDNPAHITWIDDEFHEIFTISENPPPFQPLIIERIKGSV
jgi:pyrimidine-nucleoside phosphorylase